MAVLPPNRFIHIDDYGPNGYDNGPDDLAFANARADLATYNYHTLVLGNKVYWLQNGFCLNAYTDANGVSWPALACILITSTSAIGLGDGPGGFNDLPATLVLSPGFADPSSENNGSSTRTYAYTDGSEPCRTTGSIQLADSCAILSVRIMSLAAYQYALLRADGVATLVSTDALAYGSLTGLSAPVGAAYGVFGVSAGGGTAVQFDGDNCLVDDVTILGFRNGVVCVPLFQGATGCGVRPIFGAIRGDCGNLIRVDKCNDTGKVSGPVKVYNALAGMLPQPTSAAGSTTASSSYTFGTLASGDTNILYAFESTSPTDVPIGQFVPGGAITIDLSLPPYLQQSDGTFIVTSGAGLFNANNVKMLNPAGQITNRYSATFGTVTTGGTATTPYTGSLTLAGMPIDRFFDASASQLGTFVGSISQGSNVLTVTNVISGASNVLTPGCFVTAKSAGATLSANSFIATFGTTTKKDGSGTITYTISGSNTGTASIVNGTFVTHPGTSVFGSLSGNTLSLTAAPNPPVQTGQLVIGTGVAPGTTISGSVTSTSFTYVTPQSLGPSIFQVVPTVANASIFKTTLTLIGPPVSPLPMAGYFVVGPGVAAGTTITSIAGSTAIISTSQTVSAELLAFGPGTSVTGSVCGPTLTLGNAATLLSGSAIYGNGLAANSFIQQGGSGQVFTIGVFQVLASSQNPATIPLAPANGTAGAVVIGTVTSTTKSVTLALTCNVTNGTPSANQLVFGASLPPNTYITGYSSNLATLTSNYGVIPNIPANQPFVITSGSAFSASISNGVLTTTSALTGGSTLSAGMPVLGVNCAPGSYISAGGTGPGNYFVSVAQSMPTAGYVSLLNSAMFLGSISGSVVTMSPTGTLLMGQTIFIPKTSSGTFSVVKTTISSSAAGSGGFTYTLPPSPSITNGTYLIAAAPVLASVTGSIGNGGLPNNTLTVSSTLFGSLVPGQQLRGLGITGETVITGTTTAVTLSAPCYTPSPALEMQNQTLAPPPVIMGLVAGNTLTLSTTSPVTLPTLAPGQLVIGAGIAPGTVITSVLSNLGTLATCLVDVLQNLSNGAVTALSGGALVSGSISGTTLTATTLAGTAAAGQALLFPGTYGNYLTAVVGSPNLTGTLATAQYTGNNTTFTVLSSGATQGSALVAGTIQNETLAWTAIASSSGSLPANWSVTSGAVLVDAGAQAPLLGTSIAASSGNSASLVVSQNLGGYTTLTLLNPLPSTSLTQTSIAPGGGTSTVARVRTHNQNMTAAARAQAERKT